MQQLNEYLKQLLWLIGLVQLFKITIAQKWKLHMDSGIS